MSTRRNVLTVLAGVIAGFMGRPALAQQTVGNELRITATGSVYVGQRAVGTQEVYLDAQGNHYYVRDPAQLVVNDGRIVATGDVWVEQAVAGEHEVTPAYPPPSCASGTLKMGVDGASAGRIFVQGMDCQWSEVHICTLLDRCGK